MSTEETQVQSGKSFRSYIHPVVLYLLATVCWFWVAVDPHVGSQTQLALVALIFLSAQWGLLSPCGYSKSLKYKLWVYLTPFLIGAAGVTARYLVGM
tara:strand:+ start:1464 stop:1754 length:291 start_codon:yes stop_codon:yes gene_type:complete